MLKGLIIIDDRFEETECLLTRDILKRAGIATQILALNGKEYIRSETNLVIKTDLQYPFTNYNDFDFVLVTGGMWVINFTNNASIAKKEFLNKLLNDFMHNNKLLGAICAAPLLFFNANILPKKYTCFPSVANLISYKPSDSNIVKENNIITAKAMGSTFEFALEIVETLLGVEKRKEISSQIYYE